VRPTGKKKDIREKREAMREHDTGMRNEKIIQEMRKRKTRKAETGQR